MAAKKRLNLWPRLQKSRPEPIGEPVLETPWFDVLASPSANAPDPYYTIRCCDFVVIIAVENAGRLVLVRQFRHGVNAHTLELASGHVESGDTPEETARKELLEETGYTADKFELLASLSPSTARFTNRLWCYFARDARPAPDARPEEGMEVHLYDRGLKALLSEKDFYSAPNYGALCVALLAGKLQLT